MFQTRLENSWVKLQLPLDLGREQNMKGLRRLATIALALFLVLSFLGNSNGAPQRLLERRNWTPQAMLYLKGAQGRRFISDQSRKKDLSDRPPQERRSPDPPVLTLAEAAALLLASLHKLREDGEENFDETRFLEGGLLNW